MLVSSTDGVGTKSMIARLMNRYDTIGIDLVAMSVDDIAVQGAEPLFFLDYISIGKVVPEVIDEIVAGVARGCREAGCALLGGEMSEHPDLMEPGEFDLVGFADRRRRAHRASFPRAFARATRSSASRARVCAATATRSRVARCSTAPAAGSTSRRGAARTTRSATSCIRPSVIYAPAMRKLREKVDVHAFAHVTGGGIPGNLARVLPDDCDARVDRAQVGASRGSSPRSRPPAACPTTRCSTSSISGSGCSPL